MKNEQTAVIKDMEFLLNELHKEWERPGECLGAFYGYRQFLRKYASTNAAK